MKYKIIFHNFYLFKGFLDMSVISNLKVIDKMNNLKIAKDLADDSVNITSENEDNIKFSKGGSVYKNGIGVGYMLKQSNWIFYGKDNKLLLDTQINTSNNNWENIEKSQLAIAKYLLEIKD
jgi:hypothetical protein